MTETDSKTHSLLQSEKTQRQPSESMQAATKRIHGFRDRMRQLRQDLYGDTTMPSAEKAAKKEETTRPSAEKSAKTVETKIGIQESVQKDGEESSAEEFHPSPEAAEAIKNLAAAQAAAVNQDTVPALPSHSTSIHLASGYRPALVPYPKSVSLGANSASAFVLSKATTISLGSGLSEDTPFVAAALGNLRQRLREATSQLPEPAKGEAASVISLGIVHNDGADREGYTLTTKAGQILLEARGHEGFSYGVTTVKQLIPLSIDRPAAATSLAEVADSGASNANSGILPGMVIQDSPAFKWRGLHLDVSRHFFTAKQVMTLLDTMAAYKLNRFHWHLTDDQGWRFPVAGYPELTKKGAGPRYTDTKLMSSGEGIEGSYTEQDIRDVLAFAKARHIQVIPEVDVPGHVAAAIAAYPELGNPDFDPPLGPQHAYGVHKWTLAPSHASMDFLKAVFSEVARQFPDSEYIHFGGDEAPQDQWLQSSPEAKAHWLPMPSTRHAQSFFNQKVSEIIRNNGKKVAGWDEVQAMEGLPQDAAIFAWRGENELKKALGSGRQAVNADMGHLYLDHYQGAEADEPKAIGGPLTTTKDVYQYQPCPSWVQESEKHLLLGGQAELWSEYFPDWKQVEYMAWPRAIALAERLWTPAEEASYPDFHERLNQRLGDLKHWGINFHPLQD